MGTEQSNKSKIHFKPCPPNLNQQTVECRFNHMLFKIAQ